MKKEATVKQSSTDPGERRELAGVALADAPRFSIDGWKGTRAGLTQRVEDARELPAAWREVIIAEIGLIPEHHDLLRVDMHRQTGDGRVNVAFTITHL